MRNLKNWLVVVMLISTSIIFGQTKLTGKIVDETNQPLPGASVVLKGATSGASSDFDGNFTFETSVSNGTVLVSFVGYETKTLTFNGSTNFGTIALNPSSESLEEIVITAVSFAVDRKTPVAVSTVKAEAIEVKLGTQEFPEILKSTPGVYATKAGGGYGDSRINLRGFESNNIAVMINGIPVNDMENGRVYWSNWAGLSDVTSAMQVQRGLGASKVAVPSIGGTINIISKSYDAEKGGSVRAGIGNDGYQKYGVTLSTGLLDNGFAATVSAAKIAGDGYVDGTPFDGYNYFANITKVINDQHKLAFTAFGAQQTHGQRYNRFTIAHNRATEQGGKRFNADWGYKNGQIEHVSYNFYHKPQMSLNHYWNVSDKTNISTALYASFGSGGGRREVGNKLGTDEYRLGGFDQPIDFDKVVDENIALGLAGSSDILAASKNSHNWYGILSTLKTDLSDSFALTAGIDARYYVGSHYYEVTDLLGGEFWVNTYTDSNNNYGEALKVGDRFNKDYDGKVVRGGLFAQLEYSKDKLAAFISSSVSNIEYSKEEFLNYASGTVKSKKINFTEYGVKGGANYNLDDANNIFANVGYFTKAPFLTDFVFTSDQSIEVNNNADNEKVFSAEIGYGYRSSNFSANINIYNTSWLDKAKVLSYRNPDQGGDDFLYGSLSGLDALHQGVEVDFRYTPTNKLTITGMASIGNWNWKSDGYGVVRDESGNILTEETVYAKDLKVSDAAQTTFALGATYKVLPSTSVSLDYNYAGDIYALFYVDRRTSQTADNFRKDPWKMPSYNLFDFGIVHKFKIGDLDTRLTGNINNLFNVEYVSDAFEGSTGTYTDANVYYGYGRTFSVGMKVNF
ncbi:carboxypeptidase-like regulatory domain-containing protein [uncultured Lutibacter sp.]|uniref:TonB-dependent receptor n=1 Tax=uncultured Lutibacter sp. TaxID=437739 RepID=UPI00261B335F|nr:carboxypeptidase-like regulatory domain-containing protein [uncultured Lutibacter sp.]